MERRHSQSLSQSPRTVCLTWTYGAQGMVLHKLERATNRKSCDRDAGGCGRKSTLQVFLQGPQPRCFALQLVWESGQESGLDIRETLDIVQEVRGAR